MKSKLLFFYIIIKTYDSKIYKSNLLQTCNKKDSGKKMLSKKELNK